MLIICTGESSYKPAEINGTFDDVLSGWHIDVKTNTNFFNSSGYRSGYDNNALIIYTIVGLVPNAGIYWVSNHYLNGTQNGKMCMTFYNEGITPISYWNANDGCSITI